MRGATKHHSIDDLENYSLGRLDPAAVPILEQHLLICERCRTKLCKIEPYNFVHYTEDGPFYSRITTLRNGKFLARQWGQTVVGGKEFQTRDGARAFLKRTFTRLFPEHICTPRCGPTQ